MLKVMANTFNELNGLENSSKNLISSAIWHEFNTSLRGFIRKRVSNEQDMEDILQEVFLKIHNNIEGLKDKNRIHAWVYQITRNVIIDYYRKNNKGIQLTELTEDLASKTEEDDMSANEEIAGCLRAMLDHMPEKYKNAIISTEFQNKTQKELAEQCGLSLSGAKSRVQRGRSILKEMLLDCCSLEFDHCGNVVDYNHKTKNCKFC